MIFGKVKNYIIIGFSAFTAVLLFLFNRKKEKYEELEKQHEELNKVVESDKKMKAIAEKNFNESKKVSSAITDLKIEMEAKKHRESPRNNYFVKVKR